MIDTVIAKKYARSLYRVTKGENSAEFQASFKVLLELYKIPEAKAILQSCVMPRSLKEDLLNLALSKENAPKGLQDFLFLLLDAGREKFLPEVVSCYEDLLREAAGLVVAKVTTAEVLLAKDSALIEKELERLLNKKIHLIPVIDKNVLGGVRVQVGNTVIDCSLRHKLDMLTTQVAS